MRFLLSVILLITCAQALAQSSGKPWLAHANPTVLEWAILALQADERDPDFGENQITVDFYLGPKSADEGVIYCDISYLSTASAELVQIVENGILRRFNLRQKSLYPWATLVIEKKVSRPK